MLNAALLSRQESVNYRIEIFEPDWLLQILNDACPP
jgi:hypothetical protein